MPSIQARLGCCLATSGPGGIHLLNGLYDAKLDGAPVVAITGLQFHDLLHTYTQQDVELDKLFMDVCATAIALSSQTDSAAASRSSTGRAAERAASPKSSRLRFDYSAA